MKNASIVLTFLMVMLFMAPSIMAQAPVTTDNKSKAAAKAPAKNTACCKMAEKGCKFVDNNNDGVCDNCKSTTCEGKGKCAQATGCCGKGKQNRGQNCPSQKGNVAPKTE